MSAHQTAEPGKDAPPVTEGQLVELFKTARARADPSSLLADATAANAAVGTTLNDVLAELAAVGLDAYTQYQLTHVFDALKSFVKETISLHYAAEPERPAAHAEAVKQSSPLEKLSSILKTRDNQPAEEDSSDSVSRPAPVGASAVSQSPPDRTAVATNVLDAVQKALSHVEKAFDRRPPRLTLPPPPWYQRSLLLQGIQDLLGDASREDAEDTWLDVARLKDILRQEGIQVLFYDPEAGADQQAEAFSVEDYAKSPDGRYVTDTPAIVQTGAEGIRKILIRGRVLRLPAKDVQ